MIDAEGRRVMLHTGVLTRLGQEIVDGVLEPASVVTLERVCARFGVSLTVAREAMRLLEAMRLIESRRRIGLIVRPVRMTGT